MIEEKDVSPPCGKRHSSKNISNVNLSTQKKTGGKCIMGNQGMTNWKFSAFLAIALMLVAGTFSTAIAGNGDGVVTVQTCRQKLNNESRRPDRTSRQGLINCLPAKRTIPYNSPTIVNDANSPGNVGTTTTTRVNMEGRCIPARYPPLVDGRYKEYHNHRCGDIHLRHRSRFGCTV